MFLVLAEFGIEAAAQTVDNLCHYLFDMLVLQGRFRILERERNRIRLFAFGQLFAFVDVEKADAGQEFALGLAYGILYLCHCNTFVDQQRQIALYRMCLGERGIRSGVFVRECGECSPVEFGIIYRHLYVATAGERRCHDTD